MMLQSQRRACVISGNDVVYIVCAKLLTDLALLKESLCDLSSCKGAACLFLVCVGSCSSVLHMRNYAMSCKRVVFTSDMDGMHMCFCLLTYYSRSGDHWQGNHRLCQSGSFGQPAGQGRAVCYEDLGGQTRPHSERLFLWLTKITFNFFGKCSTS